LSEGHATEVVIPVSRLKIALILVFALPFVAALSYLAMVALSDESESSFAQVLWGFGAVLGWAALGFNFLNLFGSQPGLFINRQGFMFRPTGLGFGWVDWADASDLRESGAGRTRVLWIILHNPQEYIGRGNLVQRCLKVVNWRLYGTAVALTSTSLDIDHARMVEILQRFLSEANQAEPPLLSSGPPPM
jgi:hypothetical protein